MNSRTVQHSFSYSFQVLFVMVVIAAVLSPAAFGQGADKIGQWTTLPQTMPINPIHTALLNNGKILVVSGSGNLQTNHVFSAGVWDPVSGATTTQTVGWDMFCNGMVQLSDGRILINGGNLQYNPFFGLAKASIYDPVSNTFTDTNSMAHGRWYPTPTMLADGRVMTFSGFMENGNTNNTVEIYTVGSGWSQQFTAPWNPPLYPRMHLLPNGKVFYSGPTPTSSIFDPTNQQWAVGVATTKYGGNRTYGSSVMLALTPENNYDPRIIILGGGTPATQTTELIDMGAAQPTWSFGPDMSAPRIEMNSVLLPNGQVLSLGGSINDEDTSTASLTADIYDPVSNTMSSAGSNAFARLYHSVALLMPDATVWFAGGNPNDTYEKSMEIYQPPYLFTKVGNNVVPATRPTITSSPAHVDWGNGTFTVVTPDAADITQVVIVRNGSVTHAFNMDQRLVGLSFTRGSGQLTVTGPPGGTIAPPGYYMLFLLNSAGVPSVSKQVQVGGSDFSITASPQSRLVLQGNSTNFTATINSLVAFGGTATFSVSGLPAGANATFNPPTVTGSGSTVMTVNTITSTPPGSYTLGITATAGTLVHSANVTLNVIAPLPPGQLAMDITTSTDNNGGGTTISTPAFSTAGGPELLLAFFSLDTPTSGGTTITGVTGGGLTWSLVKRQNGVLGDSEIWRALAPTALNNATVTGTLSQSGASSVTVVSFLGVDTTGNGGSGAIGATAGTSAGSGAPTASLVTTRNNSWVIGVGTDWDSALSRILGPNQTLIHQDLASVGSTYWVQSQTNPTPLSGTTVTINDTAPTTDKYNLAIAEVIPSLSTTPDFSFSGTPASRTIAAGAGTTYTATVTAQNGFSGVVTLGVTGLPTGVTGTFSPTTITGSGTSTLTITSQVTTTAGTYPLTLSGTSGSLNHTAGVSLVVTGGQDFGFSATPASRSIAAGAGTTYTSTVTAVNGFAGVVTLGVSGLPAGATGTFSPTTITGSGSSTLTITTLSTTTPNTYPLTLSGTSGSLNHTAGVSLIVTGAPDFTIATTPASQTVLVGGSTTYTTTITPQNGFSGVVTLGVSSLPANTTGSFSPPTITGSGTSTLTVTTTATTPLGSDTFTVTGTSGSLSHSNTNTIVVSSGPPPGQLAIDVTTSADKNVATTTAVSPAFSTAQANELLLAFVSSDSTASGGMTVTGVTGGGLTWALVARANGQPGDAEVWRAFAPTTLTNATVTATLASSVASSITVMSFTGADATGANGSGAIGATATVGTATGASSASLVTTRNSSWVLGVGTDWDTATARTVGPNQTMVHQLLSTVGSTYWVQRQNTTTALSGTTVTINDTAPTADKTDLAIVEILPTLTAAADFTIAGTPASQTVAAGSGTSYTATTTALNGFTGTVALTVTGLPSGASGTFTPPSITGAGTSTLAVTTSAATPPGTYSLTITGTSGSLVHTASVSLVVTAAPDFTIAGTPASQTVVVGSGTSYTATTTALNGFTGTVALTVTGLPTGATGTFTPPSITGSGSSSLAITTSATTTPPGTYPLTITGTSGTLVHTAGVSLVVTGAPDFTIAGTPSSQTVIAGAGTSYTTTTTAVNGFAGVVALSVTGLPTGATGTFTPTSITGSGTSSLAITTSATTTPAGSYTLTITGTSGTLVHTSTVTLVVTDFTIAGTPASQTVTVGSGTSYTATTTALSGFAGVVNLTVTGLPTGATGTFTPTSITGAGTSTLAVTTSTATTPPGTYTLAITGTTGALVHSATVTLVVNAAVDFTINTTPATRTGVVGASATFSNTIAAVNGFSGVVNLTITGLPTGATGTFTPPSVTGSGTSSLLVTTSATTTPPGTYTLTITGTSGSLVHSDTVTLKLNPVPDFTIAGTPASQTVQVGGGTSYTTTISAQGTFAGVVTLSASGLPTGASATFTPPTVTGSGTSTLGVTTSLSTPPGSYPLTITGTSGSLTHTAGVTLVVSDFGVSVTPASQTVVAGGNTTYTTTVSIQNGFSGTAALSVSGLPSGATGTFNPTGITGAGTSTLTVTTSTSTPVGTSTLTVTGTSGTLVHSTTATLVVTSSTSSGLAIDANVSADKNTSSTSAVSPVFSTTAANELLLAFVSADSSSVGSQSVTGIAGGGLTWVLVKRAAGQPGDAEIWRAFASTPLTNATVTATLSQSAASSITVLSFSGVDTTGVNGAGAVGASMATSSATGAPSVALITTRNNSWVFAVGTDWDHATARTLGPNQTMVHQVLSTINSTYWVQRQNAVTPLSGTTVTMNDTAPTTDKFDMAAVEVKPAP